MSVQPLPPPPPLHPFSAITAQLMDVDIGSVLGLQVALLSNVIVWFPGSNICIQLGDPWKFTVVLSPSNDISLPHLWPSIDMDAINPAL